MQNLAANSRPGQSMLVLSLFALMACGAQQSGGQLLGLRDRDVDGPASAPWQAPHHNVELAGPLCTGASATQGCQCRTTGNPEQDPPPAEGTRRFEIRMSAAGGRAILESDVLGRFEVQGGNQRCFYVDLVSGSSSRFRFHAVADREDDGVSPELALAEYGPTGPFWYDVLYVECQGPTGRCTRQGADAWRDSLKSRRRGRLDPCGSAVITNLGWDSSGGMHERDGGFFRDFTVSYVMEVKPFATSFAPGSTECVPK